MMNVLDAVASSATMAPLFPPLFLLRRPILIYKKLRRSTLWRSRRRFRGEGKNQIGPIRDEIGSFRNGRLALLWHLLMAGNDALAALPRRALQALCKQHGIKANGKVQIVRCSF